MHTFHGWQRWQSLILYAAITLFQDVALTNVDKGSHFLKSQKNWSQPLTNHDYLYIILFLKKKDKVLYYRAFSRTHSTDFDVGFFVNAVNPQIYAFLISKNIVLLSADHSTQTRNWDEPKKIRHSPMNYRIFHYLTSCAIAIICLLLWKNSYDDTQKFHRNNPGTDLFGKWGGTILRCSPLYRLCLYQSSHEVLAIRKVAR